MSAQRINLKSKPLVAGVLAALAVVACINAIVFKPGKRKAPGQQVRVQASVPVPADMGDFTRYGALPEQDLAAWERSRTPALRRDPFSGGESAATRQPQITEFEVVPVDTVQALVCNAILLGGQSPAAVINGRSYRLGENVREFKVAAIGTAGVKLVDAQGEARILPVKAENNHYRPGRIVNGKTGNERLGETSLVEHRNGERK